MKILFLTDNFPPEVNAPATRTFEHVKIWVEQGHTVTIITGAPNFPHGKVYEGYKNKLYQTEDLDGIRVIRVWTFITANEGFVKRILDYVSFAIMAFLAGVFVRTDLIIATSPQFFTAVTGRWLSLFKFKPWIMEVRDLWPESIMAVGAMKAGKVYRFLEWVELRLYKSAQKIIVVTDTFKEKITNRGISPSKISIHKNGVILDKFMPRSKDVELLQKYPQLKERKVFAYIGTLGMAHGLTFILDSAAKIAEASPELHFLFIGEGAEKNSLIEQAKRLQLENVTFIPFVPKSEVVRYLSLMDVALVNLKKSDTFKTVIPSKIFEAAALQKPILLGLEGEARKLIQDYNAGICFEPENEQEFVTACLEILEPSNYTLSQQGCALLAESFDRRKIALQLLETITKN